ncbi:hypothetical protein EYF80_022804 [Liparis tanakae]|uniref:Uncharacterized protein n=1 Tax=Liparis tanakae TaxID=230148 RepID=A0A4Z2HNB1_9TELE|nr:hypothetical protein EYF80_022804 [Liparis tanakae]
MLHLQLLLQGADAPLSRFRVAEARLGAFELKADHETCRMGNGAFPLFTLELCPAMLNPPAFISSPGHHVVSPGDRIEVLAAPGRPASIGCERTLSGGEGLFALKFNGSPLLLVLQPQEQSIPGQGPVSRDTLPI